MHKDHFSVATVCAALLIGLMVSLVAPVVRAQSTDRIRFNFSGYGNPRRPFPGYVGPFQLGPVSISGSGELRRKDGALLSGGSIVHSDNLFDRRYPTHRTTWQVVKGLGVQSSGGRTVLRLQVRVVSSNYLDICPIGTWGVIDLIDDNSRLPNGYNADGILTGMPNPASTNSRGGTACATHTHGMNNTDVSWTDPPRGGRSGGLWANVEINVATSSLPPVIHQCEPICGTWTLDGNHYNAVWNNGARAVVTFEFLNDGRVVFYRRDTTGNFTARYEGRIIGNEMKGTVRWTWNGRSSNGTWSAKW